MKHFFSLILFSLIFSLATISVAYSQILPERERATLRDEILKDRFDNL
ncbi:MAG: Xaa-Pro aminopeptidase, partial [Bacteroidetes bacterium]|nr:Xaa-Pro aminopeptidase [Bacteroidota bacterium]